MEKLQLLVARAQVGDLAAYGEIVRRFQDMGYGYAYSILGDFHLAEDAAQEAFIEAYQCLKNLREPTAFPGWFRRIVFKRCDRLTRHKEIPAAPFEAAAAIAPAGCEPSQAAEDREMKNKVLAAIRSLPEQQREVTTLFYLNGYSQSDIAEFLEVPVGTVKSRLAASRNRLKERILNMVEETLQKSAPNERFCKKVIEKLLGRPRLLQIEGHPVSEVWNAIRLALPEYEVVEGEEVVAKSDSSGVASGADRMYYLDRETVLRTETTVTTFSAMAGRTPPVHLMTAGRVFRDDLEDSSHQKVFHQLDAVCVEAGADQELMKATIRKAIEAVLQPVEFKWEQTDYPCVEQSLDIAVKHGNKWLEIAGCGMLTADTLSQAGYDPQTVSGFAFGLGLERIAILKYSIDDIRKLWAPPYVPD